MKKDVSFIFICQKGELELESCLLAASIKEFNKDSYELIAAIPETGNLGEISSFTIDFFKKLDVRIVYFKNDLLMKKEDFLLGDLVSNKIFCLNIPVKSRKLVFLDSDMLCLKPTPFNNDFFEKDFNAKQADLPTEKRWKEIYKLFDIDLPKSTIPCTVNNTLLPPYFNSGFVGINSDKAKILFGLWKDCFKKITDSKIIGDNLFYREQVSLAISVQKSNLNYGFLSEEYNFPGHLKKIDENNIPYIMHYHGTKNLLKNSLSRSLLKKLVEQYPELRLILKKHYVDLSFIE